MSKVFCSWKQIFRAREKRETKYCRVFVHTPDTRAMHGHIIVIYGTLHPTGPRPCQDRSAKRKRANFSSVSGLFAILTSSNQHWQAGIAQKKNNHMKEKSFVAGTLIHLRMKKRKKNHLAHILSNGFVEHKKKRKNSSHAFNSLDDDVNF